MLRNDVFRCGHVFWKIIQRHCTIRRGFGLNSGHLRYLRRKNNNFIILHTSSSFSSDVEVKEVPQPGVTYTELVRTSKFLLSQVPNKPEIGIICGFGMDKLTDTLSDKIEIPYDIIPNFPIGTVEGNIGRLIFGHFGGSYLVCMKGRFYQYEGYPLWKCALPIRVMKMLGADFLITSSSAGGINPAYNEGDVMLIKDHIDLMGIAGNHPLHGPNESKFGPRFFAMNKAYDKDLIDKAKYIWQEESYQGRIFDGIYTCVGGPNFETVAELRMLKQLGADAVGMSTVYEVVTAKHCGMTIFAFSLITDKCVLDYTDFDGPIYDDIMDIGRLRQDTLKKFVKKMILEVTKRVQINKTHKQPAEL